MWFKYINPRLLGDRVTYCVHKKYWYEMINIKLDSQINSSIWYRTNKNLEFNHVSPYENFYVKPMTRDKYDCWVIMIVVPIVNMGCERHEEMKYKEENKKIL